MTTERFSVPVRLRPGGGIEFDLPFDPAGAWGQRERYHVAGTLAGWPLRGQVVRDGDTHTLRLGPSWCRIHGLRTGDVAEVVLTPEGPQVDALDPDVAEALAADPDARAFFESLASFYRKGFIRPIEQAKRAETRERRIAAMMDALRAGRREA